MGSGARVVVARWRVLPTGELSPFVHNRPSFACVPVRRQGTVGCRTDRATGGTPSNADGFADRDKSSTALQRECRTRQGRPTHAGPALSSFPAGHPAQLRKPTHGPRTHTPASGALRVPERG